MCAFAEVLGQPPADDTADRGGRRTVEDPHPAMRYYVTLAEGSVVGLSHNNLAEAKALSAARKVAEYRAACGMRNPTPANLQIQPPSPDQLLWMWAAEPKRHR